MTCIRQTLDINTFFLLLLRFLNIFAPTEIKMGTKLLGWKKGKCQMSIRADKIAIY
jgi:hypothetical protein